MNKVFLLDSTLRDGAQGQGISFSIQDKLNIVSALDDLGIDYIEAGNPGSNQKDMEFFKLMETRPLQYSKLTAFGSTRRKNTEAKSDPNVLSLLEAKTDVVTIFGKSWDIHVIDILSTTLDENLNMVSDTVSFLRSMGKEVIYDAEHFFDGYKNNPEYALKTLDAAVKGGASCICLCDTNGGSFPNEVAEIVSIVKSKFDVQIGVHTHNDSGMAVANAVVGVDAGARHVQGTLVGFGERCGNANLSTIIGNLETKTEYNLVPKSKLNLLTEIVRKVADVSNVTLDTNMPYVGVNAFTHKAGMHVDGVRKNSKTFEHVAPEIVGNTRRFLMSEVAGRSVIIEKVQRFLPGITKESEEAKVIIDKVKEMEYEGFQYEGADSSFELMVMRLLNKHEDLFTIENMNTLSEQSIDKMDGRSSATVKVLVGDKQEMAAAEGEGPVNALDKAMRKALCVFYPELNNVKLTDYKVRVLDSASATAAKVRVMIETTDGVDFWTTIGVAKDIIQASCMALIDSFEYKLMKSRKG